MDYKCIIIDDEQPARRLIENYCKKLDDLMVVGSFKSALKAMPSLKEQDIDILFLDIQMPDISGLDFLKTIKTHHTKVIFTTAYREYALEGFDLDATDYLLKPIEFHRFLKAIDKVKDALGKNRTSPLTSHDNTGETIMLKADKKRYRIPLSEILYIKSDSEYIKYITQNHGTLMVHGSLKDVTQNFPKHSNFIRIHRSYIINLKHISYVEGNQVRIHHELLPISETYRGAFFDRWK